MVYHSDREAGSTADHDTYFMQPVDDIHASGNQEGQCIVTTYRNHAAKVLEFISRPTATGEVAFRCHPLQGKQKPMKEKQRQLPRLKDSVARSALTEINAD